MIHRTFLFLIAFSLASLGSLGADAQVPTSKDAPKVGEKAPDFTLPDSTGKSFTLSKVFTADEDVASGHSTWVLLYFYRGYW